MFEYTLPQILLLTDARAEAQEMAGQPTAGAPEPPRNGHRGPPTMPEDVQRRVTQMLFGGKGSVLLS